MIVTTRRGGFAVMGQVLDLYVIGLPDAVRMLRARVPGLGRVRRTVSRSRRSWAGFRWRWSKPPPGWRAPRCPAHEYLELPRSRGAELYARGQVSGRPDTIATLWNISVGRNTAEARPRYCWACARTWHPSRSLWICSPPTRTRCPSR